MSDNTLTVVITVAVWAFLLFTSVGHEILRLILTINSVGM